MIATEIDDYVGGYVSVAGYGGVAFWLDDWAKEVKEEMFSFIDDETGEVNWGWDEVEVVSDSMVECYMIGDNRKFIVDIQDLTKIDINDFCGSCGQIGCAHG